MSNNIFPADIKYNTVQNKWKNISGSRKLQIQHFLSKSTTERGLSSTEQLPRYHPDSPWVWEGGHSCLQCTSHRHNSTYWNDFSSVKASSTHSAATLNVSVADEWLESLTFMGPPWIKSCDMLKFVSVLHCCELNWFEVLTLSGTIGNLKGLFWLLFNSWTNINHNNPFAGQK